MTTEQAHKQFLLLSDDQIITSSDSVKEVRKLGKEYAKKAIGRFGIGKPRIEIINSTSGDGWYLRFDKREDGTWHSMITKGFMNLYNRNLI